MHEFITKKKLSPYITSKPIYLNISTFVRIKTTTHIIKILTFVRIRTTTHIIEIMQVFRAFLGWMWGVGYV
jgi:hypothetical protein